MRLEEGKRVTNAIQLKEVYTVCFTELETLHGKLDAFRTASAENDHLMGEFTAKRIHAIAQAKGVANEHAADTRSRMEALKATIGALVPLTYPTSRV